MDTPDQEPRRIAYDCEFIERDLTIDLVSIALVDIDSTTEMYYAISDAFDHAKFWAHDFLPGNVAPHLPWRPAGSDGSRVINTGDPRVKNRDLIRDEVIDFILGPLADGQEIQLWADYGAYDHVVTQWLWGGMAGRPPRMPMFSHDLRQYLSHTRVRGDDLPSQSAGCHDALQDALHLARCVRAVDDLSRHSAGMR